MKCKKIFSILVIVLLSINLLTINAYASENNIEKGAYGIHQSGRWYTNDNIE